MNSVKYSSCTTFGRFNIPHFGHVDLISKMLLHGEKAHVYISTGSLNNDWDTRALMLKVLCRKAGVDLSKVSFRKGSNPFRSLCDSIESSDHKETALVLGHDQYSLGCKLSSDLDVPFISNTRQFSSTSVRHLIDLECDRELRECYMNHRYPVRLSKILRQEEINRENSIKTAAKTQ